MGGINLREQQARMHDAHAAHRAEAAAPAPETDADRRINAIAESYYTGSRRVPRIRSL